MGYKFPPSGLGLHDLDFDEVPILWHSTKGSHYTRWVKVGMPRIPERVIKSVFFLYKDVDDAKAGRDPGGTGFILATGLSHLTASDGPAFYAVTNQHVACTGGFPVIRLDSLKGGTDIREFGPGEWQFIPYGPDVGDGAAGAGIRPPARNPLCSCRQLRAETWVAWHGDKRRAMRG